MHQFFRWIVLLSAALLSASCATRPVAVPGPQPVKPEADRDRAVPANSSEFVLGPGDELAIRVWRHDDLTRTVRVDPAGQIDFPLAGRVQAEGVTPADLKRELTARLAEKYLVNPQVDVAVGELRSRKVYVVGEVRSPGAFSLDARIAPWEAVSAAGGFTPDANRGKVLLVRCEQGVANVSVLDLDRTLSGRSSEVVLLRDRDLLYVPPSKIASVERFMIRFRNIVLPIVDVETGIILGNDALNVLKGTRGNTEPVIAH